jgi:hypothetical protein
MHPLKKMKEELKTLAGEVRAARQTMKNNQRAGKFDWREPGNVNYLSYSFRLKHVAYCLLRGRTYEQIEPKVREGNELDMGKVEKIMEGVRNELEALLPSAS